MTKWEKLADVGRRQFLRGSAIAALGTVASSAATPRAAAKQPAARVEYPSNRLANVADLKIDEPREISYPDKDSPGLLFKFGVPVTGGAGPGNDIVAFSTLCPHRGNPLDFRKADRSLNCPAHFSRFDCEKAGMQIMGQASQNLAQFILRIDDKGDIFAEGVDELIYGRLSNVL